MNKLVIRSTPRAEANWLAEALEPRVLFSGAPVEAPVVDEGAQHEVVVENEGDRSGGFEGIENFGKGSGGTGDEAKRGFSEIDQNLGIIVTDLRAFALQEAIDVVVDEAIENWKDSGLTSGQLRALDAIEFNIVDLEGSLLGYAEGSQVVIDADAAGRGWFVDSTPWEDSEFTGSTEGDLPGVDLLSVASHEIGHVLGLEDIVESISASKQFYGEDVMVGLFAEGERRIIGEGRAQGAEALSLEGQHFAHTSLNQVTVADQAGWDAVVGTLSAADEVVFNGAGGTINISGSVTVGAIHFESGNYTLGGGTIVLAETGGPVEVDVDATIDSMIDGTVGLTKTGNGKLTLSGTNTFTGATNIDAGKVVAGSNSALGNNTAVTIAAAGILDLGGNDLTIGSLAGSGIVESNSITLLADDFGADSTPTLTGRVYESTLDGGWYKTSPFSTQIASAWNITGGQLENPTADTVSYVQSETPAYQWWTNPLAGISDATTLEITFDYDVGSGDTLTAHFWAAQNGGVGTNSWITNNQGWSNGNSGQNQDQSQNYDTFNLLDGDTTPDGGDHITGALTGTGTFTWTVDVSTLGIPGVSTVGDLDTLFFAFAADESGGGTTSVDNLKIEAGVSPTLSIGGDNTSTTFSGTIRDGSDGYSLSLRKTGSGILTLGGDNTYTGTTTIGAISSPDTNILRITHANALGATGASSNTIIESRGSLQVSGGITTGEHITNKGGGGGNINGVSGGGTLTGLITLEGGMDVRGSDLTFSGGITSTANQSLGLNGSRITVDTNPIELNGGTFTVTSAGNNKANATQLNVGGNDWGLARISFSGYLLLGGSNYMPTDAGMEFGWNLIGQSSATLDLNGFDQTVTSIAQSSNSFGEGGDIKITDTTGTGTFTINLTSGSAEYQGRFEGGTSIVKTGAGTQIVDNQSGTASAHSGTTAIDGGILEIRSGVDIGDSSVVRLGDSAGGGLNVTGTGNFETIGGLTGGGSTGGNINVATGNTLTIVTAAATTDIFAGAITGPGGLTQNGDATGVQVLSGTNTYSGPTTVSAGTLQFAKQGSFYNNTPGSWTATNLIVNTGGTAAFNVGGPDEFTSSDVDIIQALGSPTGGFQTGSSIGIDTTNAVGTFTHGSVLADTNGGSNSVGLTKLGTGALALTGTSSYTGTTFIAEGTLEAGSVDALGNGGDITFTGGELQYTAASAASDLSTRIVNSTSAITIDTNGQDVTFGTAIPNTNTAGLTKKGAGLLDLKMGTSYSGTTTINDGMLRFTNVADLNGVSTSAFLINNGSTLEFQSSVGGANRTVLNNKTFTFGTASGGTINFNGGNHLFQGGSNTHNFVTTGGTKNTISSTNGGFMNMQGAGNIIFDVADGTDDTDLEFSATFSNGDLTKNGDGTMLVATSTGVGFGDDVVTINAGTLLVGASHTLSSGAEAGDPVNVGSGAALGGSGTVGGDVNVADGGGLEAGLGGAGTLTLSRDLDLSAAATAGTLAFELGATSDLIDLTSGVLDIGSGSLGFNEFSFSDVGGLVSGTYTLIQTTQSITGTLDSSNLSGSIGAFTGTLAISGDGTDLILTVTGPPVIDQGDGPLNVTMDEDGAPTAFVAPSISATDTDSLTWFLATGVEATNGTATVSGTGVSPTITYVPTPNYNGSDSFTVEVSDGNGGSDTIVVNVTINPVEDGPDVTVVDITRTEDNGDQVNDPATTYTDVPVATYIDGGPADEADQTLAGYSVVGATNSSIYKNGVIPTINANGEISFTTASNASGFSEVTIRVTDSGGGTTDKTFRITVTPENEDPSFNLGSDTVTDTGDLPFALGAFQDVVERISPDSPSIIVKGVPTPSGQANPVGDLTLNGSQVTVDQEIPVSALGNAIFTPDTTSGNTWNGTLRLSYQIRFADGSLSSELVYGFGASQEAQIRGNVSVSGGRAGSPVIVDGFVSNIDFGDVDPGTLRFEVITRFPDGWFSEEPSVSLDGTLRFTASPGAQGTSLATLDLTDGNRSYGRQSFLIELINGGTGDSGSPELGRIVTRSLVFDLLQRDKGLGLSGLNGPGFESDGQVILAFSGSGEFGDAQSALEALIGLGGFGNSGTSVLLFTDFADFESVIQSLTGNGIATEGFRIVDLDQLGAQDGLIHGGMRIPINSEDESGVDDTGEEGGNTEPQSEGEEVDSAKNEEKTKIPLSAVEEVVDSLLN